MKNILSMKYILIFFITLVTVSSLHAQERITDEEQARSIFENVDDRRSSNSTETAEMSMVITDSRDRTRSRTMQFWSKIEGDDTYSLIIFSAPGNVRGTGFLSVNEDGNTTQRLYLPTVGRIQLK
jgi:murein L,D-transpeptidase YafK